MADTHCPYCGSSLPADAEVCPVCNSPIEQLPQPSEDFPDWLKELQGVSSPSLEPENEGEIPDWLSKIRERARQDQSMRADVEAGDEETSAEWLQELAGGQIPGELPVESEPTDWLDRLSPNETEEPAEENKPETPADEGEPPSQADEVSDWLKKLHDQEPEEPAQPESEIPAQPVEPIEATPDLSAWLSSLDGETPQEPPAGEGTPPPEEKSDWLIQFQAATPPEAETGAGLFPEKEPAADETPDWLSHLQSESASGETPEEEIQPADEVPDWLKEYEQEPPVEEETPAEVIPVGAETPEEEIQPAHEVPDWLKEYEQEPPVEEETPAEVLPVGVETPEEEIQPAHEVPDWLKEHEQEPLPAEEEIPARTIESVPASPQEAETPQESPEEEILPDWLTITSEETPQEQPVGGEGVPSWVDAPVESPPPVPAADATPAWLSDFAAAAPVTPKDQLDEEGEPISAFVEGSEDWLNLPGSSQSPALPETTGMEVLGEGVDIVPPFLSEQVPDWLGKPPPQAATDGEEITPEPEVEEPFIEGEGSLEEASLPTWLEAMRPVEAVAPSRVPKVQNKVEFTGPLAGIQGVLQGEDTAIHYNKPPTYSGRLRLSEAQQNHANILQEVMKSLVEPQPITSETRLVPQKITRFLVMFLLLIVMLAPILGATQTSSMPTIVPSYVNTFSKTLQSLGTDSPRILVAVDYEASLAGEVQMISSGVLQDLAVMLDVEVDPAVHGELRDALVLVDQAADDHLAHLAQAGAGGAGPGRLVEGEIGHAHLGYGAAAGWDGRVGQMRGDGWRGPRLPLPGGHGDRSVGYGAGHP